MRSVIGGCISVQFFALLVYLQPSIAVYELQYAYTEMEAPCPLGIATTSDNVVKATTNGSDVFVELTRVKKMKGTRKSIMIQIDLDFSRKCDDASRKPKTEDSAKPNTYARRYVKLKCTKQPPELTQSDKGFNFNVTFRHVMKGCYKVQMDVLDIYYTIIASGYSREPLEVLGDGRSEEEMKYKFTSTPPSHDVNECHDGECLRTIKITPPFFGPFQLAVVLFNQSLEKTYDSSNNASSSEILDNCTYQFNKEGVPDKSDKNSNFRCHAGSSCKLSTEEDSSDIECTFKYKVKGNISFSVYFRNDNAYGRGGFERTFLYNQDHRDFNLDTSKREPGSQTDSTSVKGGWNAGHTGLLTLIIVPCLVFLVACLMFVRRIRSKPSGVRANRTAESERIPEHSPLAVKDNNDEKFKVLMLYAREDEYLTALVERLRKDLQNYPGCCEVIDFYHDDYAKEVYRNGPEFVNGMIRRLESSNLKIIVIHTTLGVDIPNANGPCIYKDQEPLDDFYLSAVRTVQAQTKRNNDYRTVFNVEFTEKPAHRTAVFNSCVVYKYPDHFEALCKEIDKQRQPSKIIPNYILLRDREEQER